MKYPDINIQIRYPNKLINADTPLDCYKKEISGIQTYLPYFCKLCATMKGRLEIQTLILYSLSLSSIARLVVLTNEFMQKLEFNGSKEFLTF